MRDDSIILNGRYRLLQRAGSGGMSTVYKGQDLLLGRLVAVKILHDSLTGDKQFLKRFQQEAHKAANLSHPNIVMVHDIGQDERTYYIIMEYIEGWTLKDLIRQQMDSARTPMSLERSLDLAIQICAGVGYAHRANLVHCDVKSQNILVARDDRAKVTDFGIARALSETSVHRGDLVWGTPQYFSPEQAAGANATPASDVYSIGVILFEMLTGRLPFEAESHTALAMKHIQDVPPLVTEFNGTVPDQIVRIVAKVLAKEPAGRYRTADQFGRVLRAFRESSFEDTGPVAIPQAVEQEQAPVSVAEQTRVQVQSASTSPRRREFENRYPDKHIPVPEKDPVLDRTAVILAIIALISLLGLIPLWYIVYLQYTG